MTPILNCVLGVESPWQDVWHEDEPYASLLEASNGECGLHYDDENDVCYFGLILYRGEAHELEETLEYCPLQSITNVKEFVRKHSVEGVVGLYFFTTFT